MGRHYHQHGWVQLGASIECGPRGERLPSSCTVCALSLSFMALRAPPQDTNSEEIQSDHLLRREHCSYRFYRNNLSLVKTYLNRLPAIPYMYYLIKIALHYEKETWLRLNDSVLFHRQLLGYYFTSHTLLCFSLPTLPLTRPAPLHNGPLLAPLSSLLLLLSLILALPLPWRCRRRGWAGLQERIGRIIRRESIGSRATG